MSSVVVGRFEDWKHGEARKALVGDVAVAIVRIDDAVYAIGDVCSHANVSLSDGTVWDDECALECPRHGSAFDLRTGVPNSLPATQPVRVFVARVVNGEVVVEAES